MSQGIYRRLPVDGFIEVVNDLLYGAIFTHYFSREKVDLANSARLIADIFLNGVVSDQRCREHLKGGEKSANTEES